MAATTPTTTSVCRALWLAATLVAIVWHQWVDGCIQAIWDVLRASTVVRHDTFEPTVAVTAFLVSFTFWKALDCWLPAGLTKRWRIGESDDMSTWHLSKWWTRLLQEPVWYFAPIAIFDVMYPRRNLPEKAPSIEKLAIDILAPLFIYDFMFFFIHVTCHKVRFLYRNIHAKHHSEKIMRAGETIRLSFFEQWADVSCSIIAVNVARCHPLSRALYNGIIVYLLTELHSGSRRHYVHHRDGRFYYQKFFCYLDDFFGFGEDARASIRTGKEN